MTNLYSDLDAWRAYPQHRHWFNKLDFSLAMGYRCGPCGVAPDVSADYIVRPIYNLEGMGVGARKQWIDAWDVSKVEPGYFWCEWFTGPQYSVTYEWDNKWVPISVWQGVLEDNSLSRFSSWKKIPVFNIPLPSLFDTLSDTQRINVEFIGDRPIEVHLRCSPDPDWGDEIIPVWEDSPVDEEWVPAYDNAHGFLPVARLGFIVR